MSDNNEEYPETGTGGVGITLVTDPGTKDAVEQNESTTSHMGHASEGGKLMTPSPPNGGEGKTGRARAPSERERNAPRNNAVEGDALTGHVQRAAENIQTQVVSDAPEGASKLQSDVYGSVAASANERDTVPGVLHVSIETNTEVIQIRTPTPRCNAQSNQVYATQLR